MSTASWLTSVGYFVALTDGEPDALDRTHRSVDDALARWSSGGFHLQHANALHARIALDLYARDSARAAERIRNQWRALRRSLVLRAQIMRSILVSARARVLIAEAARTGRHAELAEAERLARGLERERADHLVGQGQGARACIALVRGDLARAARLLATAEATLERARMDLHVATYRHARGVLIGGDQGAALEARAATFMDDHGLHDLAGVTRIHVPGLPA